MGSGLLVAKKILTMVTNICRTFLWTGSTDHSRKALVAWDKLCLPRSAGGLNIIDIFKWNKAALCKLLWAVALKEDRLWIQWIHGIYIKTQDLMQMKTPQQASWLVKKIFEARQWLAEAGDPITMLEGMVDKGRFSIKKAYRSLMPQYEKVSWKSLVLAKGLLPRHQFILWLAVQKRLSTVDRLKRWRVQVSQNCVLCETDSIEDLAHLFFSCPYSNNMWRILTRWAGIIRPIGNWDEEVTWYSRKVNNCRPKAGILGFLFAATVYQIWSEKNRRRFTNQKLESKQLIREIIDRKSVV